MTDLKVLELAKEVAEVFGVKIDERLVLNSIHSHNAITPVVICSPEVTIWIDRQCIKLCEHDEIDIVYIYTTLVYAKAELRRIKGSLSGVNTQNEFIMLMGMVKQLRRAVGYMEDTGSDYFVFNDEIPW